MPPARILIGVIGAPHGVRGELRVKPFTDDPLAMKDYGPLETEDGSRVFKIAAARLQGDMVIARFEGITDRDVAASLTHTRLFVPRDRLPDTEEDEFYQSDLIGLRVEDSSGTVLGKIIAVEDFGAGDVLEISRDNLPSVHLPFTRTFVPTVDVKAGRVVAEPPAGIFDDEGGEEPKP
ncbi:ribosome maturation factor RimM [Flaviflagellibacter deserti]|jgi:16S rRNA processing protein RimM|uniref:Ribosome maturation factor RimM n=1 Tax=Flaviflagellibacter deserti TaxID=2267266 RepID=A0ABV9Z5F7_9HYPH